MSEAGLLPCPKCQGEATIEQTGPKEITIRCFELDPSIGLRGCGIMYRQRVRTHSLEWLRGIMTEAWNRRASAPSHAALLAEVERYKEALTPSGETKVAYIGEFHFNIEDRDEDGEECSRTVAVPWTTVKEIMKAIAARAALEQSHGG